MQLFKGIHPHIVDDPPLPPAGENVLHSCTIETMYIIVGLLGFGQSRTTEIRHSGEVMTFVYAIISTHFTIKEQPMIS